MKIFKPLNEHQKLIIFCSIFINLMVTIAIVCSYVESRNVISESTPKIEQRKIIKRLNNNLIYGHLRIITGLTKAPDTVKKQKFNELKRYVFDSVDDKDIPRDKAYKETMETLYYTLGDIPINIIDKESYNSYKEKVEELFEPYKS